MHEEIEVEMRVTEFYSPLSFLGILLKANRNRPYRVIQMKSEDFKGFQNSLKILQFYNSTIYHTLNKSSHQRCSIKKVFLSISQIRRKTPSLFFNRVAGLYLKRDSATGVFLCIL